MVFKNNKNRPKKKATSHKKYFNYHKLGYFEVITSIPIRDKIIFIYIITHNLNLILALKD